MLDTALGQAVELLSVSPALFVENQGQWADAAVEYAHFGAGASVLHTGDGLVFHLYQQEDGSGANELPDPLAEPEEVVMQHTQFTVTFDGASLVDPVGLNQTETVHNYYVGDQANWRSGVPTYETVGYLGLYDGIDLLTTGQRGSLKYEFRVAPGADYQQISFTFDGISGLSLDSDGALHVSTELGDLIDSTPYIYQEIGGEQVAVGGAFQLVDADTVSFNVTGNYDPTAALVIDPELDWSTYLGGNADETGYGMTVDAVGNILVTGYTRSSGWVSGGFDTDFNGGSDVFVAKLSDTGQHIWSTYLGGNSDDGGYGIATDGAGNALVTGSTRSSGWVSGGFDTSFNGYYDVFVAKLSDVGQHLWSTYLGGGSQDVGFDIALDTAGNVLVTGDTYSSGWVSGGFDTDFDGGIADAFVAKLSATGQHVWSTYLGGDSYDRGWGIAVDAADNALVSGFTHSSGWVSGGFDTSYNGTYDAFVAKLSATGQHVWSTYLGGNYDDFGFDIAVDAAGNAMVTGNTDSSGSVWVSGGFDTTPNGDWDAFVVKLSATGQHVWSTYLGGSTGDFGRDIAVDTAGNALVAGFTRSTSLDWDSFDGFVARLTATGQYGWWIDVGGNTYDIAEGIAVDAAGNALVTGRTYSSGWVSGGFDTSHNGGADAFVARIVSDNGSTDNHPPTVVAPIGTVTANEDDPNWTVDLSTVFDDVDMAGGSESLTFTVESNSNSTLVYAYIAGDTLTLDFLPDQNGVASIVVRATDTGDLYAEDTVSLTVNPVNDMTVADDQTVTVTEDGSVTITLSGSDLETAEENLTFTITSLPLGGILVDSAGNAVEVGDAFTGPPTLTYGKGGACQGEGSTSFTFTVTDRGDPDGAPGANPEAAPLESAAATVTIDVTQAVADGTVTVDAAGVVRIGGTPGDDVIYVTHTADGQFLHVTLNGVVDTSIPLAGITEVRVWGRAGNDHIELIDLALTAMLHGGADDDELIGSHGSDLIFGSLGNDTITGASGNDFLIGGAGVDRIVGSAGHDILAAGEMACWYTGAALRAALADWVLAHWDDDGTSDDVLDEAPITDEDYDMLTGSSGADLFLIGDGDKITDLKKTTKDGDVVWVV